MQTTRSSLRRRSLGDDSKPTTPGNELGRKLDEGTVRRSLRMKYKELGRTLDDVAEYLKYQKLGGKLDEEAAELVKYKELGWKLYEPKQRRPRKKNIEEDRKQAALKKRLGIRPKIMRQLKPKDPRYIKSLAEYALWDYNKNQGTDLEFVRILDDKQSPIFFGPGFGINFVERQCSWKHINFEVRRRNDADPKPFLLFAEVYPCDDKCTLTALSLVKPTDEEHSCRRCGSCVSHPPHGFRAGFDTKKACEPKLLSEQEADKLAKFAIQDHNEKHGTNMKFERALGCNSFTCAGLVMDFSKKNASWVHMNFEARVGPHELVCQLFAELFLVDDEKYVLATLSVAEPSKNTWHGNWTEKINLECGCLCCPESIRHPWRGFSFAFNYPPRRKQGPVAKDEV